MLSNWKRAVAAALLTLMAGMPVMADEGADKGGPDVTPARTLPGQAEAVPVKPAAPTFWIGAMCFPARGVVRAQLDLSEGQGLVVMTLVADSPAAKAGFQKHDILLTANEKSLDSVRDLSKMVAESEGKEITFVLLRTGQRQTIRVTPGERPKHPAAVAMAPDAKKQEALQHLFQQLAPNVKALPQGRARLRLRFVQPGVIFGSRKVEAGWPKDLNVTVTRQGDQPMRIRVEQDGKQWDINRKELGKLPEKILPFVERMLGKTSMAKPPAEAIEIEMPRVQFPPAKPEAEPAEPKLKTPQPSDLKANLPQTLDGLNQKLQELQKQLEAIEDDRN